MTYVDPKYFNTSPPIAHCHTEGKPVVFLPFSEYELANLAEMFKAIIPGRSENKGHQPSPFSVFDSGDWTGVLHDRFLMAAKLFAPGRAPNVTAEKYIYGASQR